MELMVKIVLVGLLLLVFSGCFRKKAGTGNLRDWLEKHYPGRFQVLSTTSDDAIRNMSFKVKKSVVAEVANPMIQVLLRYDLRQPDLGLNTQQVNALFTNSAKAWEDAQAFCKILKSSGLGSWSAGIRDGAASALVFAEPTPELRRECLFQLEKALAEWSAAADYDKELLLMEPSGVEENGGKTLPLSYWLESGGQYSKQVIFRVSCPYDQAFKAAELEKKWEFNADNIRFSGYLEQSRSAVEKWATLNLKPPFRFLDEMEFEAGERVHVLKFTFPFTQQSSIEGDSTEITPAGSIVAEYDIDRKVVKNIRAAEH